MIANIISSINNYKSQHFYTRSLLQSESFSLFDWSQAGPSIILLHRHSRDFRMFCLFRSGLKFCKNRVGIPVFLSIIPWRSTRGGSALLYTYHIA